MGGTPLFFLALCLARKKEGSDLKRRLGIEDWVLSVRSVRPLSLCCVAVRWLVRRSGTSNFQRLRKSDYE